MVFMIYRTHFLGGIALYMIVAGPTYSTLPFPESLIYLSIAGVAGTLNDIDHPKSIISQKGFGLARLLGVPFKHRGFLHSLPFIVLVFLFLWPIKIFVPPQVARGLVAFQWGLASHIILDMFTNHGVYLFSPFLYDRVGFKIINTASKSEWFFQRVLGFLIATMGSFAMLNYLLGVSVEDLLIQVQQFWSIG